jgi:PAS domain S-box-containing protein
MISYAVPLYRQLILRSSDASSKLSQAQTLKASKINQPLPPNLESLIAEQTTKLEDAINQLQTELTRRLQIKESLLYLSKAVEEASDAICITDADGFPTDINKAFWQFFGYSIDELNAIEGLFTLFATREVGEEIHNLILNGYPWEGEVEMRTRHAEIIQVELHAEPIENQTSQIIVIVFVFTNVSKRQQVEAALQKSEERLRSALKAAHLATWEWDLKTRKIVWFDNLESVFGFNPKTFRGDLETLLEYIHPDDHQKLTYAVGYAVDEHVDYKIEFRSLWPDGSIHWMESKGQLLYDETGQAVQMLGTVLDITKRREAEAARQLLEEKRRQSQEMLQLVMDNIPQFIFWKDRNSVFSGCNQNFARVAGVGTPENIVGKTDYDLPWKKEESDLFRERDAHVMETDTPEYHVVETQLQADGKQAIVDTNKIPLHDPEGNVVGILGTYEDVTEHKQAEAALRASEAELHALFAAMTDVILVLDAQGHYLKIAPTNPPLLYKPAEELVGKTPHEIFAPAQAEFFLDCIRRALDTQQTIDLEYSLSINGTQVWFAARISPLYEDIVICVARDITERKRKGSVNR